MNRFILPGSIAAGLHAVLFFGFPSSPVASVKTKPSTLPDDRKVPVIEIVKPETRDIERSPEPSRGGPAVPDIADSIKDANKDDFTIPVRPSLNPTQGIGITSIPISWPGLSGTGPIIAGPPSLPSFKDLDNPPRTRVQIPPDYPHAARAGGLDGEVTVEFLVDEGGRVLEPRAVASTDRMFEEPAVRAVSKWRFVPGTIHGIPVRFRMAAPIVFKLND